MNREDFDYFYEIRRRNESLSEEIEQKQKEIVFLKSVINAYDRCLSRIQQEVNNKYGFIADIIIKPIINEEQAFIDELKKENNYEPQPDKPAAD